MAGQLNSRTPSGIQDPPGSGKYRLCEAEDVEKWMKDPDHVMTWHESPDGSSLDKVPTILHGNIDHKGGQNQVRGEVNDVFLKDMPQKDKKNKNKKTTASAGNGAFGDTGESVLGENY